MFGQMKDMYNLRKQAQELQKQLENEKIIGTSKDGLITVTINGNHEILDVKIDSAKELDRLKLETAFKSAYKAAADELKTTLSRKFADMV